MTSRRLNSSVKEEEEYLKWKCVPVGGDGLGSEVGLWDLFLFLIGCRLEEEELDEAALMDISKQSTRNRRRRRRACIVSEGKEGRGEHLYLMIVTSSFLLSSYFSLALPCIRLYVHPNTLVSIGSIL